MKSKRIKQIDYLISRGYLALTVYYIYTTWPKVFEQYKFQMIHNNKLIIYLMSLTPPEKCKYIKFAHLL